MTSPFTIDTPTADQAGPIDYLILEFPHGRADAGAFATLRLLAEHDLIHVLDLEFVARRDDGRVSLVESGDAVAAADGDLTAFLGATSGLLDDDDIRQVGDLVAPGSLAAIIIFENLWVLSMARDLQRVDATIMGTGSIPLQDIDRALSNA